MPRPADIRFVDVDGNGTIDEDDKAYCGTGIPKMEANLNFSGSYKGFDLSFSLGGAFGHKLYNGNRYFYESMSAPGNMLSQRSQCLDSPKHSHQRSACHLQ